MQLLKSSDWEVVKQPCHCTSLQVVATIGQDGRKHDMSKSTALTALMAINWRGRKHGFEVPGKLPLFQLSTLHYIAKETRFIDLTLCSMQTGQLVNTRIWALVIDMNWICCTNATSNWQQLARH